MLRHVLRTFAHVHIHLEHVSWLTVSILTYAILMIRSCQALKCNYCFNPWHQGKRMHTLTGCDMSTQAKLPGKAADNFKKFDLERCKDLPQEELRPAITATGVMNLSLHYLWDKCGNKNQKAYHMCVL